MRQAGIRERASAALSIALAAAIVASPLAAQTPPGEAAFAARDFIRAAPLLRREAAAGSAQAMLHLGTMADLGLGAAQDAAAAFRWYLAAAGAGNVDAQFNVAVMLDAGAGRTREPRAAATWYARAAAQGHTRAQYNLGLLLAAGDGVPRNTRLARLWLNRAAQLLPAAAERAARLQPPADAGADPAAAPELASVLVVGPADARLGLFSWAAAPGAPGERFVLEIVTRPTAAHPRSRDVARIDTPATAITVPLAGPNDLAWRVRRTNRRTGLDAASAWQALDLDPAAAAPTALAQPAARVTLRHAPGDAGAIRLAGRLADALAEEGAWVDVRQAAAQNATKRTQVHFADATAAPLARRIAASLPGPDGLSALPAPFDTAASAPGEITVDIVGGPN
jgi:hypothetical protein